MKLFSANFKVTFMRPPAMPLLWCRFLHPLDAETAPLDTRKFYRSAIWMTEVTRERLNFQLMFFNRPAALVRTFLRLNLAIYIRNQRCRSNFFDMSGLQ